VADTNYEADYVRKPKPFCDVIVDELREIPRDPPFAQLSQGQALGPVLQFSFPVR